MASIHSESTDLLFETILKLETIDDCYRFFEDLCTIKEIRDISQRLCVAQLLHQGMNYQNISRLVDVSSATISRVNRCLNYGSGGYRAALEKMNVPKEAK